MSRPQASKQHARFVITAWPLHLCCVFSFVTR